MEENVVFGRPITRMLVSTFNWPICVWYSQAVDEYGIDMNPDYQRGLVWDIEHKTKLIDSIIEGIGVPALLLREFEGFTQKYHYELVDGKQRLSTIVEFMEDGFPYNGKLFSEWDLLSQRVFKNACIGASVIRFTNDEEVRELYQRVNFGGVAHK
jgi:uncharacterized protein with ParB-like and HNH nuclease domain